MGQDGTALAEMSRCCDLSITGLCTGGNTPRKKFTFSKTKVLLTSGCYPSDRRLDGYLLTGRTGGVSIALWRSVPVPAASVASGG